MRIKVKLFATLGRYGPPGSESGKFFVVELPEGSSITALVTALDIPKAEVKIVFVDGRIRPEEFILTADVDVGIFPPIGGG